ncbi:MAG TPA: hypothetical protein VMH86_06340 [Rhizomicrobium sp.]|nr:hypothetical protein [Rhizomicrobium sp.]
MPKVILVSGISNSGKTKSIRRFLENRGIHHIKRKGDVTVVVPIQKNGKSYAIGVASGGDNLGVVRRNLTFIDRYHWDVVVCASRSRGQTPQYVRNFAQQNRAKFVRLRTKHVKGKPAITAAISRIASQVERNLP